MAKGSWRRRWVWRVVGGLATWLGLFFGVFGGLALICVGLPALVIWTGDRGKTPRKWYVLAATGLAAVLGSLTGGFVGALLASMLSGGDFDHSILWLGIVQLFLIAGGALLGSVNGAVLAGLAFGKGPKLPSAGGPP